MSIYENGQATALELLTRFGQRITIKRETGDSLDPVTGVKTPGAVTEYSAMGVVADYGLKYISGTLIQKGDKKITLAVKGLSIIPELSDRVIINDVEYGIVTITEVNPAGTPLTYVLQARR